MSKNIFFEDIDNLGVFRDLNNPKSFYGMPIDSANMKRTIEKQFINQIIPDEKTIKVYKILYAGERDNYSQTFRTDRTIMIDFPINGIEGIMVRLIDK